MVLKLNTLAPKFSLPDKDNVIHNLDDIQSKYTIVYFYPKDNTSGCKTEAINFNENLSKLSKLGVTVIGISGGNEKTKKKFIDSNNLKFLLLTDADFKVAKKYNSYGEKKFMGRTYNGIFRNTFILDKDKKIIKIFEKVKPKDHITEVLDFLNSL